MIGDGGSQRARQPGKALLVVLAGLAVFFMLAPGGSAGAGKAKGPLMKKVPAHFVYVTGTTPCTWGIGIDFPSVPGATGYVVSYWDGYYGRVVVTTVTPAQLGTDPAAAKGTLYLGVTGGGYSPPCNSDTDATEGGRFSKGATAFASLPPGKRFKLSGTVRLGCGCDSSGLPAANVTVDIRGRDSVTATTGADGKYEVSVRSGSYTVLPSAPGWHFKPKHRKVSLAKANVGGKDFAGCPASSGGAAPRARDIAHAASAVTLRGGPKTCFNTVMVTYDPASPSTRPLVSWHANAMRCTIAGGVPFTDATVQADVLRPTPYPVGAAGHPGESVQNSQGVLTITVSAPDGAAMMLIKIAKDTKRATAELFNDGRSFLGSDGANGHAQCQVRPTRKGQPITLKQPRVDHSRLFRSGSPWSPGR